MKRTILIVILGVLSILNVQAKKIEGQIIFENDTTNVTMVIPMIFMSGDINFRKLQSKLKYYDSNGVKHVLRPGQGKEFRFTFGHEEIRMLSRKNSLHLARPAKKYTFLRLTIDGKTKLFSYYFFTLGAVAPLGGQSQASGPYLAERFIIQKENAEIESTEFWTTEDLTKFFSDCPEIVSRIEKKQYRLRYLLTIVRFYNDTCQ